MAEVPQYAVPLKLFLFVPLIAGFFLKPLWPAYGEALVRKDFDWVRRTLLTSLKLCLLVVCPLSIALIVFGRSLILLWVGPAISLTTTLSIGLGLFVIVSVANSCVTKLLHGAKVFRFQLICMSLMVLVNIPLSIYLTKRLGVSGVIWGTVISRTVFMFIPQFAYSMSMLRTFGNNPLGQSQLLTVSQ